MEFTEIHQLSSFSINHFHISNHQSSLNLHHHIPDNSISQSNHSQFIQTLQLLQQINPHFPHQSIQISPNHTNLHFSQQLNSNCHQQTAQKEQQFTSNKKYDRTKSLIFNHSLSIKNSLGTNQIGYQVKVYYFGTPLMKSISYNQKTTIKQLIKKSLDAYLLQKNHDMQASQPVQKFEMRLPTSENEFTPDLCIESIHNERILSENMFETLILIEKPKQEFSSSKKNQQKNNKKNSIETKSTKEYSIQEPSIRESFFQRQNEEKVTLKLMDEKYNQLIRMDLQKNGTLERIFKQIRDRNLNEGREFVIKEDPDSEFDLSGEHEVRLIQKNRIYLMTKIYLDEGQDELPAPICLKSFVRQEINYLPPLGMTEASRYEEFQVTKINSLGIAIERVLGIDQTKIYNYQKQLKINQRQTNLIDKFLGFNPQTGTKIPSRFIKEIISIQKFAGGIEVIFPQKTTTFLIKNQIDLYKIYRKLQFLLDFNKNSQKKASFPDLKIPKRITTFLNF